MKLALSLVLAASLAPWPTFRNGPTNAGHTPLTVRTLAADARRPTTFDTGGLVWGTAVVDAAGNTYVGAANKRFYSLDGLGRERWHYDLTDRADALVDSAAALAPNNLVVVPGGDGLLHALDRTTGRLVWRFAAHGATEAEHQKGAVVNSFEGNVQVGPDGTLYAGSDNGTLYAVGLDGRERWHLRTGLMIWSSPVVTDNWLAFGSLDGHFYLVDTATGKLLDRFDAGSEVKSSPALDAAGRLYVGTSQGEVLALDVQRERLKLAWRFHTGAEVYASPALTDDGVVVGTLDGTVYALSHTGHERWRYLTRSRVSSSAVVSADGVALLGARNGKLYALDVRDGHRLWSYQAADAPRKSNLDASVAVAGDGMATVGAYNGLVTRLPLAYPPSHPSDPRVESGGTEDWPENGLPPGPDTVALVYQARDGRLSPAPPWPVGLAPVLRLKLAARQHGHPRDGLALNPDVRASLAGGPPVEVTLASDGRSLNVVPKGLLAPNTAYWLHLKGSYREQASAWWCDRLVPRASGKLDTRLRFTTGPNLPVGAACTAWGARGLYLFQPEALETYTPAALDGQGFVLASAGRAGNRGVLVGLPALPTAAGVRPLAEPARVFLLDAQWNEGWLQGEGAFTVSAMGGTIPFTRVQMQGRFDGQGGVQSGEFLATTNLLGLRGNDAGYSFPMGLLNEVADHQLRLVAEGTFDGAPIVGGPPALLADCVYRPGAPASVSLAPAPVARLVVAIATHAGTAVAWACARVPASPDGTLLTLPLAPRAGHALAEADRLVVLRADE